ncbi:phage Gp37/Gp68 family protein [Mycobacterium marinum]|nr:phage Gp37/Gp68 family protein [Mycobacterium marinum]WOR07332.1 phage Gp37/Gp68 family protein [Mycobacterium marinum]
MADHTAISWADVTWNPVSGCTRISPGCDHCYIERTPPLRMAHRRFDGDGVGSTTGVQLHPERLEIPLHWRKPRKVFVCSLADLFHDEVPDEYIAHVFATMQSCAAHTFQVLTKRAARMHSLLNSDRFWEAVTDFGSILMGKRPSRAQWWPDHGLQHHYLPNVWGMVTAENQGWAGKRIPLLLDTPFVVRGVSLEPLLGPIDLFGGFENPGPAIVRTGVRTQVDGPWGPAEYDYGDQIGVDWVVTGGESGPGARPAHPDWFRSIRDQCQAAGVAFHFKQWGEWSPYPPVGAEQSPQTYVSAKIHGGGCLCEQAPMWRVGKKAGRLLDGREHNDYPEVIDHA